MGTLLTRSHRLARIDTQEQAMETRARTRALGPKHHGGCACCFKKGKTEKEKKKKKTKGEGGENHSRTRTVRLCLHCSVVAQMQRQQDWLTCSFMAPAFITFHICCSERRKRWFISLFACTRASHLRFAYVCNTYSHGCVLCVCVCVCVFTALLRFNF